MLSTQRALVTAEELAPFPLFQQLSPPELNRLSQLFCRRSFAPGESLLLAGHTSDMVYIVLTGTVRIALDDPRHGVTVTFCGPGDILGEMSAIDGLGHSANVIATEACLCAAIERAVFCPLLEEMPRLTLNLYRSAAGRLRLATTRIYALAAYDVQGRVARQLLVFAHRYAGDASDSTAPVSIPLRLTQTDIGTLVGATRVSVHKALKVFAHKGYLSCDRRYRITIHDRAGLLQHCR